ncbi:MAG: hypothetical protein KGD64_10750 [Candidatus Heimdallarchaeota archaeon]|nr:hypothetical protein [Candidatus Heimdallarchaeota archaeon]
MKTKKNKVVFFVFFTLVLFSSTMLIKEVRATSTTIQKPTSGQQFNSLLNGDYITFKFIIIGYYESYNTYIDGQLDYSLHHVGVDIQYDAKSFIDKYGRGTHTFDVTVSTGGPTPFSVTTKSIVMDSVSFTVDPPICHFVGFGYDFYDEYSLPYPLRWRSNIEPFRDMLLSDRAKYIPGYFATHYDWDDDDVISILDTLDTKEKQQDIVVVLFSAHGHAVGPPPSWGAWTHSHTTTWFHEPEWTPAYKGVTASELKGWLSDLETDNLIYIMETCHSEGFHYRGKQLTNKKHVMVACEWDESSINLLEAYNPSWSLETRINNMNSPFLKQMCQSFYFNYYNTDTAFDLSLIHI